MSPSPLRRPIAARARRSIRPAVDPLEGRLLLTAGDLDPTLAGTGYVVRNVIDDLDAGGTVAVQPDGKVLVGRASYGFANEDFTIFRLNVDGSLDTTFGTGGSVRTDFASNRDVLQGLFYDAARNKIVAVGLANASNGSGKIAIARYNPNGSLDTTFGTKGKVLTYYNAKGASGAGIHSAAMDSSGRIVVAGDSASKGVNSAAVARFNPDGSFDATFGSGGSAIGAPAGASGVRWYNVGLLAGGKIALTGEATGNLAVYARLNPNGTFDATLNAGKTVVLGPSFSGPSWSVEADRVAFFADGSFAGIRQVEGPFWAEIQVARFRADGTPDPNFGVGGVVTTTPANFGSLNPTLDYPDFMQAMDVAVDPGGQLVVAGRVRIDGRTGGIDNLLLRYNADGSLDTGFGVGGAVMTSTNGDGLENFNRIAFQPDRKIVAVGQVRPGYMIDANVYRNQDTLVARYDGSASAPLLAAASLTPTIAASPSGIATPAPAPAPAPAGQPVVIIPDAPAIPQPPATPWWSTPASKKRR